MTERMVDSSPLGCRWARSYRHRLHRGFYGGTLADVADSTRKLLDQIEQAILDHTVPTTSILNMCVVFGARTGSDSLRAWANRELQGYESDDELPSYRTVKSNIYVDATTGSAMITGQGLSAEQLPRIAREAGLGSDVPMRNGLGELEALAAAGQSVKISLPRSDIIGHALDRSSPNPFQHTMAVYWSIANATVQGIIARVRSTLASLVSELIVALPAGETSVPTSDMTDQAVKVTIGNVGAKAQITVNTGQSQGASYTSAGSTAPPDER